MVVMTVVECVWGDACASSTTFPVAFFVGSSGKAYGFRDFVNSMWACWCGDCGFWGWHCVKTIFLRGECDFFTIISATL